MLRLTRNPYREIERKLGYRFRRRELLALALIHRSHRFESEGVTADNQRLEFLGDAALGLVAGAHIYAHYAAEDEGGLTNLRSQLTCGKTLAHVARGIQLGDQLQLGRGEEQSGGRHRPSILADALEAVLGAAYLDGGLRAVERIFAALFVPLVVTAPEAGGFENPKGNLQEIVQRHHLAGPHYRLVQSEGPGHARIFTIEVLVGGRVLGRGVESSRHAAEVQAAREAVAALRRGPEHQAAGGEGAAQ